MISISSLEHTVLERAEKGHGTATHWFAHACGFGENTAKARRLLRRMANAGLVEGVPASRSGRVFWWKITDAGRAVLARTANKTANTTRPKGENPNHSAALPHAPGIVEDDECRKGELW